MKIIILKTKNQECRVSVIKNTSKIFYDRNLDTEIQNILPLMLWKLKFPTAPMTYLQAQQKAQQLQQKYNIPIIEWNYPKDEFPQYTIKDVKEFYKAWKSYHIDYNGLINSDLYDFCKENNDNTKEPFILIEKWKPLWEKWRRQMSADNAVAILNTNKNQYRVAYLQNPECLDFQDNLPLYTYVCWASVFQNSKIFDNPEDAEKEAVLIADGDYLEYGIITVDYPEKEFPILNKTEIDELWQLLVTKYTKKRTKLIKKYRRVLEQLGVWEEYNV